jgi:ubiquinone/menaquinone biosynthesis C-methylase UbiE
MASKSAHRSYNAVAWFYEATARWYSLGQIGASKAWQVQHLKPGADVLYPGVGTGEDALLAARAGATVTCVDPAEKMLQRAQRRIEAEGLAAEFVCADVTAMEANASYDAVAANYFFTLFDDERMVEVMDHLVEMLKPGGRLMIADFTPQRGTGWRRALQTSHRVFANWLYWAIGLAHLGPIREYPEFLEAAGLNLVAIQEFPLTRWGPNSFWSMVAELPADTA